MGTTEGMKIRSVVAAVVLSGLALVVKQEASAQVPPYKDSLGIYQRGKLVGEVYREGGSETNYVEHWVLYPGYVYPSPANKASFELRPGQAEYKDAATFLAKVPFEKGSRYVKTSCEDGTSIPGR